MYVFYADESGFSKGGKFELEQPVTVVAGVLIDKTKLFKALRVFDSILTEINHDLDDKIDELKFNDIKQNKYPYSQNFPKIDDKADLLERIILQFQQEVSFKVLYAAVDDLKFFEAKKKKSFALISRLKHPYLVAAYRVISQIQHVQERKKKNKGKTFVILDEQNIFQEDIEKLVMQPIHLSEFSEVIDTTYFGKSHYSKLIQIADLMAGIIRFHLTNIHMNKPKKYFNTRIAGIYDSIKHNAVFKECFKEDLKALYNEVEIKNP